MGTPSFALPTLTALHGAGHQIAACYTRPPRPAGRGRRITPSPVEIAARAMGIPVETPDTLRDAAAQARLASIGPDVCVVAAYGLLLPQAVLDIAPMGCLNVHASLLPRWRGAAPIQRAILAGDDELGVTVMRIDAGMDTGPMLAARRFTADRMTTGEATERMALLGSEAMLAMLDDMDAHPEIAQPADGACHAPKIAKDEAMLDFTQDAEAVERAVRAFNPAPGAWTTIAGGRLIVHACEVADARGRPGEILDVHGTIACGRRAIRPTRVQRAGRSPVEGHAVRQALEGARGLSCGS